MGFYELRRWGQLLDVLSEMSDIERQLVTQGTNPRVFLPDELLDRWYMTFRSGRGLREIGVSDLILSILLEFDHYLDQLIEVLPDTADNKEEYIRYDETWQAVRELADWTLVRIADLAISDQPPFSMS